MQNLNLHVIGNHEFRFQIIPGDCPILSIMVGPFKTEIFLHQGSVDNALETIEAAIRVYQIESRIVEGDNL